MIRRGLRRLVNALPGAEERRIRGELVRRKAVFLKLEYQSGLSARMLNASQLYEYFGRDHGSGVCHVIGSGASLLDSMDKIRQGVDKVIGFNFSALANIEFDIYFCEGASDEREDLKLISEAQSVLLVEHASDRINKLFFKNLWEGKLKRGYIESKYPDHTPILRDIHLPLTVSISGDVKTNKRIVRHLFDRDNCYIRQIETTTLTAIVVAMKSGFREIVVHGFDFSGPHFYCDPSINWPDSISTKARERIMASCAATKNGKRKHNSANAAFLVPHIQAYLKKRGVDLCAASGQSPLSELLPVFRS